MSEFAGTGALIRLILRRDRIVLPVWVLIIGLLPMAIVSAFEELLPTQAAIEAFVQGIKGSPAELALLGPVYASSIGGLTSWRWLAAGAIIVGLASALTVIRHTRSEEQAGRRELLGSTVVGRHAQLAASLIVTFAATSLAGIIGAAGLIYVGLDTPGAIAFGLSMAGAGYTFAALAGLVAQISEGSGAAKVIIGVSLAAFHMIRAVGDVSGPAGAIGWLSWASPIGWAHLIQPFADEQWWVFALFVAAAIILTFGAFAIEAQRDMGAGLLRPRPGRAEGAPSLSSPLALAWRLQRALMASWVGGYIGLGLVLGFIGQTVAEQVTTNPQVAQMLALLGGKAGYIDVFFTAMLVLLGGEVTAIYAIQASLKLRSEELDGRAELVLATKVSRVQWAISHFVFMVIGPAIALGALGAATGLSYGLASGDVAHELPRLLTAALAFLPAIWVLGGISALLYGIAPRLTAAAWGILGGFFLLDFLGQLLRAPQEVLDISPFAHVPKLLINQGAASPLIWLTIIAAALVFTGLAGFRRREVG